MPKPHAEPLPSNCARQECNKSLLTVMVPWFFHHDKTKDPIGPYCSKECGRLDNGMEAPARKAPVQAQASVPQQAAKSAPKPKPTGEKRTPGIKVAGLWRPGSSLAIVYERLQDQKWHPVEEVIAELPAKNPRWALDCVIQTGIDNGTWSAREENEHVKIKLTQKEA